MELGLSQTPWERGLLAKALIKSLSKIPTGKECANKYHDLMIGILEYIFWPNLTCPDKEVKIHEGRKRIDITYTNAAIEGFFYRIHNAHHISSTLIMVECKNYTNNVSAPEFDQLSGRFSVNRGKFGILVYRNTNDYTVLLQKCKDTAQDGRGFIFTLGDEQIIDLLKLIADTQRADVELYLDKLFKKIIT